MIVNIYPAQSGDSFLINFKNGKNIIIDMGFTETYDDYIKRDLEEINKANQKIDLLVITHIDEDHIEGAIKFIRENSFSDSYKIVRVEEVWYNSYRHLPISKKGKLDKDSDEPRILDSIKKANMRTSKIGINEKKEISAFQGSTLASLLYGYDYNWNSKFDNKAVNKDFKDKIDIEGICINILSPNTKKLKNLARDWLSFLRGKKYNFKIANDEIFDDAYEIYNRNKGEFDVKESNPVCSESSKFSINESIQYNLITEDSSKSNGASIALEIIYEDKKMLFLGDCHEDILMESLKSKMNDQETLYYDIIKVSHHGSIRNNSKWIELVKARYYIFSTDGISHKEHPSKSLIAAIIKKNENSEQKITLIFNYMLDFINELNNKELIKKYNYDLLVRNNEKTVVRI